MNFRTWMVLGILCAVVAGCGQKGALVRPEPRSATVIDPMTPSTMGSP